MIFLSHGNRDCIHILMCIHLLMWSLIPHSSSCFPVGELNPPGSHNVNYYLGGRARGKKHLFKLGVLCELNTLCQALSPPVPGEGTSQADELRMLLITRDVTMAAGQDFWSGSLRLWFLEVRCVSRNESLPCEVHTPGDAPKPCPPSGKLLSSAASGPLVT